MAGYLMTALKTLPADATRLDGGTGFVGPDVPIDLLMATGRPFGHLPWNIRPTPWADRWLESAFPYWARSIVEQWHEGRFDAVAQVVFSRSDDVSQRLYYYVRELQRRGKLGGPEALVLDIALIPRASSLQHTVAALGDCAASLSIDRATIGTAIRRGNELRRTLVRIDAARVSNGPDYEQLARSALYSDASGWIDSVRVPQGPPRPRVLLVGSVPPDERLHVAAEEGGASIVAELHVSALTRSGDPLEFHVGDELAALARHLVATSIGPRSFVDRTRLLQARVRSASVGGVILWQTREEEGLTWHVPSQRRALEAMGIPALVMAGRDWRAEDGARESITTFCKELTR
ncbi:MAG: 2-hydroxyacyl-CoA dehydratase family protein [Steroidobacteraceae bacterium]